MHHTIFNRLAFLLALVLLAWATIAYGGVHQPVIATIYLGISLLILLWFFDGIKSGFNYSNALIQLPIYLLAFYGLVQTISFGSYTNLDGFGDIARTISFDPFSTKVASLHILALGIYFSVLLVLFDRESRLRKTAIFITVFGFVYAFYAILQSVLSPLRIYGLYESAFAEPFGSFVSRNNFAAWISLSMAIPLGLLLSGALKKDKVLLYITATALMGVSLLLSGSRGGLVAFIAEILVLLLISYSPKQKSRVVMKFGLAALLLLLVAAGAVFVGGETSLTRIANERGVTDTTTSRSYIWSVTAKIIADSFPLGVGIGAFPQAFSKFDANSGTARVEQAHNDYLQLLSDAGLPGALLGLWFLWLLIRISGKTITSSQGYQRGLAAGSIAGIFACLIHSIFDFVLHTTAIAMLFLTLLAILVSSANLPAQENKVVSGKRRYRKSNFFEKKIRKSLGA